MKNQQKGFVIPLTIMAVAILLIGGIYLYSKPQPNITPVVDTETATTSGQTLPSAAFSNNSNKTAANSTSDWETYTNSQHGYSLAYPVNTKIDTSSDATEKSVLFQLPNSNGQFIVKTVKPSADCKDNAYGSDPSIKTISGLTYTVYTADKYFSVKTSATAREYCTVKNGIEYKLYTIMPYVGTPIDVDANVALNNMIKSFRIE